MTTTRPSSRRSTPRRSLATRRSDSARCRPWATSPRFEQARRLHADGGHEQALFLLTRLLELAPLHPEASALASECRQALEHECLAAVGSASAVLVVALSPQELKRFNLDNVSGFLLSVMDGGTDVDTILDIAGLPRLLALRHLRKLLERGIVAVGSSVRGR